MKHAIYRILILSSLLIVGCTAISQTTSKNDYYFEDNSGNSFSITDISKLPIPLDSIFFRQHLTASSFHPNKNELSDSFFYSIKEIKVVKKKKEFELTVHARPKTNDVVTILKNSGYVHYRLKIDRGQNGSQRVTIEYLFVEI